MQGYPLLERGRVNSSYPQATNCPEKIGSSCNRVWIFDMRMRGQYRMN